jgi:hypothetical protein
MVRRGLDGAAWLSMVRRGLVGGGEGGGSRNSRWPPRNKGKQ